MGENMVTLKLTGPLSRKQAERLRAKDVKEYPTPGLDITVPAGEARALIDAGYAAGVEPTEPEQVRAALETKTGKAAKADTAKNDTAKS